MNELGIEKHLRNKARDLYSRYSVLKDYLLKNVYTYWGQSFPGGNDHGPEHIARVLEYLDKLLGPNAARALNVYELFLAMMAILYHDVGVLRQRDKHADISKWFLEQEEKSYIFGEHDRGIIAAAVVSHSSSKNIEEELSGFLETEPIGGHTVRPRVIAALVRFADELDEDHRRANSTAAEFLPLPERSKRYWDFCRRVIGIDLKQSDRQIHFNVQFEDEDVGRILADDEGGRSFVSWFAEKLAKINRERGVVNKFLPPEIRYYSIHVFVKLPASVGSRWNRPRQFVFTDETQAADFVRYFPELSVEPANRWMEDALEFIRKGQLDEADRELRRLAEVSADLSPDMRLRILYDRACVESRRAEELKPKAAARKKALDAGLKYLQAWLHLGLDSAFRETARTPRNEIYRMGNDSDLQCLLVERLDAVVEMIEEDLRSALPRHLFNRRSGGSKGGGEGGGGQPRAKKRERTYRGVGGGCVPAGTAILMPGGECRVEELREGAAILSFDLEEMSGPLVAGVLRVHASREPLLIRLNRRYIFTPSQPLYERQKGWTLAEDLMPGMYLLAAGLKLTPISHVERLRNYSEVYTLTTDHPTHNYVAHGLICANKRSMAPDIF